MRIYLFTFPFILCRDSDGLQNRGILARCTFRSLQPKVRCCINWPQRKHCLYCLNTSCWIIGLAQVLLIQELKCLLSISDKRCHSKCSVNRSVQAITTYRSPQTKEDQFRLYRGPGVALNATVGLVSSHMNHVLMNGPWGPPIPGRSLYC